MWLGIIVTTNTSKRDRRIHNLHIHIHIHIYIYLHKYSYIVDDLKLSFLVRRFNSWPNKMRLFMASSECIVWVLNRLSMVQLFVFLRISCFFPFFSLLRLQIVFTYVLFFHLYSCLVICVSLPCIWKGVWIAHWIVVHRFFKHNRTEGTNKERFVVHKPTSYTVISQVKNDTTSTLRIPFRHGRKQWQIYYPKLVGKVAH